MVDSSDPRWSHPSRIAGELLVQIGAGSYNKGLYRAFLAGAGATTIDDTTLAAINVEIVHCPDPVIQRLSADLENQGYAFFAEPHMSGSHTSVTPNDTLYSSQYHLPLIACPAGWAQAESGSASPAVIIGHTDSGVDPNHPDLVANLVPGFSWLADSTSTDTHDRHGHGTKTAGAVNAVTNNAAGVAGVAFNAKLMPLVVMDSTGFASWANVSAGFIYAADHGCRVITCSIGGTGGSSTLQSAVQYAQGKGVVVCCAAGNSSSAVPLYPAAYADCSVGATDANDNLASFSNYGTAANIYAPGVNIETTFNGSGYGLASGTSLSCPIVAGVVCLMISGQSALLRSDLATEIIAAANCDTVPAGNRVNANKAIAAAIAATPTSPPVTDTPTVSITNPASGATVTGVVSIAAAATSNLPITKGTITVDGKGLSTALNGNILTANWNTKKVAKGAHTIAATATNSAGNTGTATPITVTK